MILATGAVRAARPARQSGYLYGTYENPTNAGDGYSMAYHAGAELSGIECFQINPLIKDYNGPACAYVANPFGGYQVNADGERFVDSDYWSGQMMAEVKREIESARGPIYLKVTHLPEGRERPGGQRRGHEPGAVGHQEAEPLGVGGGVRGDLGAVGLGGVVADEDAVEARVLVGPGEAPKLVLVDGRAARRARLGLVLRADHADELDGHGVSPLSYCRLNLPEIYDNAVTWPAEPHDLVREPAGLSCSGATASGSAAGWRRLTSSGAASRAEPTAHTAMT